ncbi:MAG TPA: hypothetical protein VHM25_12030, partial [Polyangiaceae bacterium]|nr:hypothetical protein [Polyangiaceae bacterium]
GGTANGGSATGGSGSGGKGGSGGTASAGAPSGGSSSGGSPSTTCAGLADWSSKTYKVGDTVANVCSGPFAPAGQAGKAHKFECNPTAGSAALPWCQQREPGVGNGWNEAWVDKGACQ